MKESLCMLCDTVYDYDNKKERETHEHPEPQSGPFRNDWIKSGLSYCEWVAKTESGKLWNSRHK